MSADASNFDDGALYEALKLHDPKFDGEFFVGVSSTKIYCRPICRAKLPKKENCTFFLSAAAAEAKGYRPCKLCRPESAPRPSKISPETKSACEMMEENCFQDVDISKLCEVLGINVCDLEGSFQSDLGCSPKEHQRTQQLLLAKALLKETSLPLEDISLSAGFGTVGDLNQVFLKKYRQKPEDFRGPKRPVESLDGSITLTYGYRPPYAWDELLKFLDGRAIFGVEEVLKNSYRRTVSLEKGGSKFTGWIVVEKETQDEGLSITVSSSLIPVLPAVLGRVRKMFDMDCNPQEIHAKISSLEEISDVKCVEGLRLPGSFDPFEMSVRAVLGQQITVKAARTLAKRIVESLGGFIETPFGGLNRSFPSPRKMLELPKPIEDVLGPLGVTGIRSKAIGALARGIEKGDISFAPQIDPKAEFKKLLDLPGFGPWTVQYVGMRAYSYPDFFLHTDYGIKKALPDFSGKEILEKSRKWSPWRSYATLNLWNSLSNQKVGRNDDI